MHQPARLEDAIGQEKSVRRHEVHAWMRRPARQQRAEDARERALADGDAAGDADDVRRRRRQRAEERLTRRMEGLSRRDVQVQEPGERQIDGADFVE